MLEIRNITKVYRSKSGGSVKALDNVSVTFPETGMVFILGKSGSGKSTLLNVIGGLDGCDEGEFIIKGKSSKQFAGSDFDAYRNTFIGFIFQEYNVLDDFSVGANIGLALELQGKKATNEKISEILAQVDMLDYAKRKPNELSGGQKQRVAIARALVKDPEIIMADEPTGALDSNTGKQIFDTLKELSKTKLVVIVSHDRDFAERYGDRIIEMKDGQILSDVTKHEVEAEALSSGILKMTDKLLRIEKGYQLTPKDVETINEYLRSQTADILISGDSRLNDGVRSAAGISQNNSASVFNDTDESKDVKKKEYKGSETKFIRSRLPMKNAIKMGGNSLGHKKFRLVVTIILSLVAFTLFGFADTLGAYNKLTAATDSIRDSYVKNASFTLELKHTWVSNDYSSSNYSQTAMNDEDIKQISERTGIDFIPVFNGSMYDMGGNIQLTDHMSDISNIEPSGSAYTGNLYGMTTLDEDRIAKLGFNVTGSMPQSSDEIAISELIYRQLKFTGFTNDEYDESVKKNELTADANGGDNSIIGKHITLRINDKKYTFKITAVIDTAFEYDRYADYVPDENSIQSPDNESDLMDMIMTIELSNTLRYGFHSLGYVSKDALDSMCQDMQNNGMMSYIGVNLYQSYNLVSDEEFEDQVWENQYMWFYRVGQSSDIPSLGNITWLDSTPKTTLGKNEILVHSELLNRVSLNADINDKVMTALQGLYGEYLGEDFYSIGDAATQAAYEQYINDEALFNSLRAELTESYCEYYGYEKPGEPNFVMLDDETLKGFWRDCMEWNHSFLPEASMNRDEIRVKAYRDTVEAIFGTALGEDLTEDMCSNILNNIGKDGAEGRFMFSKDSAIWILTYQYAYEELLNNAELYDSEQFFNEVMKNYGYRDFDEWLQMHDEHRFREAVNAYQNYIRWQEKENNAFGDKTAADFENEATELYYDITGDSLSRYFEKMYIKRSTWDENGERNEKLTEYKIVGLFDGGMSDVIISDDLYAENEAYGEEYDITQEIIAPHDPGVYAFVIAPMPDDESTIRQLVEISYETGGDLVFKLRNQVMDSLESFNDFIEVGAQIFLYIGIGFAVFSALMLMNFISVSISYKRREIGILRAVGARSSDVFKIFFSEAFMIALINFTLSLAATIVATTVFNNVVRESGINVTLLSFGFRQVALMFLVSVFVAAVASFLPVWNIARRKPVDAIKNK